MFIEVLHFSFGLSPLCNIYQDRGFLIIMWISLGHGSKQMTMTERNPTSLILTTFGICKTILSPWKLWTLWWKQRSQLLVMYKYVRVNAYKSKGTSYYIYDFQGRGCSHGAKTLKGCTFQTHMSIHECKIGVLIWIFSYDVSG